MQNTIGFIGAGHMTGAIVAGLVSKSTTYQIGRDQILISSRGQDKLRALCDRHHVLAATSNEQIVESCDVVVLSVKPQQLAEVISPLAQLFQKHKPLVISVAAGISCTSIGAWIGEDIAVIRSMPNMPSVIGEGATGLFANDNASELHRQQASEIFSGMGVVSWLKEESDINKVTALSGSGPAYFMLMIHSLIEAGIDSGLTAESAKELAVQTARGTAGMINQSEKPLEQLIEDMLLPGGTTEQAVAELRRRELPETIKAAFNAALLRATEIASELG